MGLKEKELDIFGLTQLDTIFFKGVLEENINENIKINCISSEEQIKKPRKTPIVLLTGKFLIKKAKDIYPDSKIIIPKRMITGYNLEKIMVLPKDEKVLVVNHPKNVVIETIESLKEFGINHLKYIPFGGNNTNYDDINTAISPGHIFMCPEEIENKIDIGRRTISFSTFTEIITSLGLDNENLDNFANSHVKQMVKSSRKVAELLVKSERVSKNLESVLNQTKDKILAINQENQIVLFNPGAEKLFGARKKEAINEDYNNLFYNNKDFLDFLNKTESVDDIIVKFGDKKLIGSLDIIKTGGEEVKVVIFSEVERIQKLEENVRRKLHKKGHIAKYTFDDIVSESRVMKDLKARAKNFAKNDMSILIEGETGTGKELFAHAIHNDSNRKNRPFIGINFGAIPENLVESELFGYEEGAFTGAAKGGKTGLFEQAHNGTIFLDEIGDAPISTQSRLLRVMQEKEVMRLGNSKVIPVDVRVIAATNKDLSELINENKFREDLYYRLKVLPLYIPPLRERKDDIFALIDIITSKFERNDIVSEDVKDMLLSHDWPGNARELENVINYIFAVSDNNYISKDDLPFELRENHSLKESGGESIEKIKYELTSSTGDIEEYRVILEVLKENEGKCLGRKNILKHCKQKGIYLSETKIRTRLEKLENLDLIETGKTRQGTNIRCEGINFLGQLESK